MAVAESGYPAIGTPQSIFELTSRLIRQARFAISVDEMVTRGLISKGL